MKPVFFECTNPNCGLRYPVDLDLFSGQYCPRCGFSVKSSKSSAPEGPINKGAGVPVLPVWGLVDNVRSAFNVGSMFRIADGAGLQGLYLCGITPTPYESSSICKTALGAELSMPWSYHPNALSLALKLLDQGFTLVSLECTPGAIPLFEFHLDRVSSPRILLVVGGEQSGVDPAILALSHAIVLIPMHGIKESLNAAVAFGIATYWLTRV